MRFRLLGPLTIEDDEHVVPLTARRQRVLLAVLLLNANAPVPGATIIDVLWRDEPPASASTALRGLLSQLRRVLEPDRPTGEPSIIERAPAGWSIRVAPDALDTSRFEAASAEGREAHVAGDLERASACYRRALAEWRGPALVDVADDIENAHIAATRWEELRLQTLEQCIEAELDLGRHREVASELMELVEAHPFRERFVSLLMIALYRDGRQAEALRVFVEARERLVEELGIEPMLDLADLERSILLHEPGLLNSIGASTAPLPPTGSTAQPTAPTDPTPAEFPALPRHLAERRERSTIVGREAELAVADVVRGEITAGRWAVLAIEGPAGIGKSRLTAEICAAFHREGGRVLFGRSDRDTLISYQPVIEALADHLADSPDLDGLRARTWPDELRRLVPELSNDEGQESRSTTLSFNRRSTDRPGAPPEVMSGRRSAESEGRYALFEAMVELLEQLSEVRPVTLVIDDLQWADEATMALLRHVVRRLPDHRTLIVVTVRNDETSVDDELRQLLADIEREHRLYTIALGRLDPEASLELLRELWPDERSDLLDLAPRVFQLAEGNPLFLRQLARHIESKPVGSGLDDDLGLPDEIFTLVRSRLQSLSPDAGSLLANGAVIGREFDLDVLAAVVGSEPDDVLDAMDELFARRLVNEVGGVVDRYSFTHELVREVSYRSLSSSRRARSHQRAGEALEKLDANAYASRLAHHFSLAGPAERERAAWYAFDAGEQAMSVLAFGDAVTHFQQALRLARLAELGVEREVQMLLALGESLISAGHTVIGRRTYREAAGLARRAELYELFAFALLGQGGQWGNSEEIDESFIEALEDALARLTDEQATLRARVAARLATAVFFMSGVDASEPLGIEALRLARAQTDDAALASAIHARHLVLQIVGAPADRMALADEQVTRTSDGSPESRATARWNRTINLIELGRRAAIDAELVSYREHAESGRQPVNLWWSEVLEGTVATSRGDLSRAELHVERAHELGTDLGQEDADRVYSGQLYLLRWLQDRLAELVPVCEALLAQQPDFQPWRAAVALALAETGDHAGARRHLVELVDALDHGPRDYLWLGTMVLAAEVAYVIDDADAAPTVLARLAPYAGRHLMYGPGLAAFGPVDRSIGQLLLVGGDREVAVRTLIEAEHMAEAGGVTPYLLLARTARLGAAPDAAAADGEELRSIADRAQQLGLLGVARRVEHLQGGLTSS